MVSILSPGVYLIEKDLSIYPPSLASTTVGIVGFATKGPVNKATLITSQENLVNTFGPPSEYLGGQGLIGALEILETTNSVYYVRASDGTAKDASATISLGSCPAIAVSAASIGANKAVTFLVQVIDNNGTSAFSSNKTYVVPSGLSEADGVQQRALVEAFGNDLESLKVSCQFPMTTVNGIKVPGGLTTSDAGILVGSFSGKAARLYVSASEPVLIPIDISGNLTGPAVNSYTASGSTILATGASSLNYLAQSLYPGTGYNLSSVNGKTLGNSVEIKALGGESFTVVVNDSGGAYESFKASLTNAKDTFITDVINAGVVDAKSDIIKANIYYSTSSVDDLQALENFSDNIANLVPDANAVSAQVGTSTSYVTANPRFVKPIAGTYNLDGGTNGEGTSKLTTIIGDAADKTGLYVLDDDILNLSVALVPGYHDQEIQNALITLAETTTAFLAVVSPPQSKGTVQEAIDWSNGFADDRTTAINSSYAAIYWPHVQTFIPTYGKEQWVDPAIYGARQIVYTAGVSELWFAPAGFIRGRLTKPTDVEVRLSQGDRDTMYSGGNVINPIVNFPQQGLTIFGQRTAQRAPTALDRINVRMLSIYLKKILLQSVQSLLFEPNDPILWDLVTDIVNPILEDVKQRRGITDYSVVCDETTNTPLRVDRNELWCKVVIQPTKTAEAIVFELNLTSQSGTIS